MGDHNGLEVILVVLWDGEEVQRVEVWLIGDLQNVKSAPNDNTRTPTTMKSFFLSTAGLLAWKSLSSCEAWSREGSKARQGSTRPCGRKATER
jgi:hypothetical protein